MKQKKSNKPNPDGGTIDPELDKDLDYLIKKGFIEKIKKNGQVIYGITPLGDKYAKEVLLKKNKNNISNLP